MAGEEFVKSMQQIAAPRMGEITDIVIGQVVSVSPLKIKVGTLELPASFLYLSPLVIEKIVYINEVPITIWEGLILGDRVQILRCDRGQKYYVLQKMDLPG